MNHLPKLGLAAAIIAALGLAACQQQADPETTASQQQ